MPRIARLTPTLAMSVALPLLGLAAPALAEVKTAECHASALTSNGTYDCDAKIAWNVDVREEGQHIGIELAAPAGHCARVSYHLQGDSVDFVGHTFFLAAGEVETLDLGTKLPVGVQRFYIRAEGEPGGCLVDRMASWGVEARAVILP